MNGDIVNGFDGFKSLVVNKDCLDPAIETIFFLLSEDHQIDAAHFLWEYRPELIRRILQRRVLQNWYHALFLASKILS